MRISKWLRRRERATDSPPLPKRPDKEIANIVSQVIKAEVLAEALLLSVIGRNIAEKGNKWA